ncbi:DUF6482 family protein [Pseudoalteromonas fenneropenaei]|uniref:DUF6482 family protein n=1 Tax=Pseudoalteromonas fenneropenaei TaxID=1737459 RepID=A0ABV7CLF3_9GAMM
MHSTLLKRHFATRDLAAVILSYADSNHYLAGGMDRQGNYQLLSDFHGHTVTFNSLREAEDALRELGVTQANLEMETAYDEMVGGYAGGRSSIAISLVH